MSLNTPVVQVTAEPDTKTVKNGRNRRHNPGDDLGSRGEATTESPKLVGLAEGYEPQEFAGVRMDGNLQVRLLQVDEDHPVSLTD